MMSSAAVEKSDDTAMQHCASCGIAGGGDIKLMKCTACHLVKYCSVKCQKDHRPKHKKKCKKRAAELKEEILFKQPESTHYGDCPICCLPVPIDNSKSTLFLCCGKRICNGCNIAKAMREREEGLQYKCPFCRKVLPKSDEEAKQLLMKRVDANDPIAVCHFGSRSYNKGDYKTAVEYWTRAASLGDADAHYHLSRLYHEGVGVEKDKKKELHHVKEAAIAGHPEARHNLACVEGGHGPARAVKHFIIAANLGYDHSLDALKTLYKDGLVSKDVFSAALRGYQTAIEATKSPQREEAYLRAPKKGI